MHPKKIPHQRLISFWLAVFQSQQEQGVWSAWWSRLFAFGSLVATEGNPWLDLVVSTQRWGMLHLVCEKLQEINLHGRHSMFRNRMQRKWIGWCWQVSDMKSWGSQKRTQVKEIIESYWPFNDFALRSLLLSKCNLWAIHRGCQLCRGIRHTLNTHESICNVWVSFKEVHVTPLPEK